MTADYAAERAEAVRLLPICRLNPTKFGLERWLGPLETLVMEAMWANDYPRTVKGVWKELGQLGHPQVYTTIMTTMTRLYQKGMLNRDKPGQGYAYRVRETRAQFEERQIAAARASIEETAE